MIDCQRGERKHVIAEEYLATHTVGVGVFLILVARAPAPVWKVKRSAAGVIVSIERNVEYVNHYSFHIIDPAWGHVTIKMSGHPPFGAQVILNGHEYVACAAQHAGVGFVKEGNCFTAVSDPAHLAQIAVTVSQPGTVGRLSQVCDRWIYSACLCLALDSDEQHRSGSRYNYSVYQVEYSRNLLFANGAQMQTVFDAVVDRTRSRLDVPAVRTLFGAKHRPHRNRKSGPPRLEAVIETPRYDLTIFKIHFGLLTLKASTKGERVLRVEAITHNTKDLGCGRVLDKFPDIVTRLQASMLGATGVGGVDLNQARMRNTAAAVLALAVAPTGFTVGELAAKVHTMTGQTDDDFPLRQAAYDLRKLRAKHLVDKLGRTHRYHVPPDAARVMAGLVTLRDQIIAPILAGIRSPHPGRKPTHRTAVDRDYEQLRITMHKLFDDRAIERAAS